MHDLFNKNNIPKYNYHIFFPANVPILTEGGFCKFSFPRPPPLPIKSGNSTSTYNFSLNSLEFETPHPLDFGVSNDFH